MIVNNCFTKKNAVFPSNKENTNNKFHVNSQLALFFVYKMNCSFKKEDRTDFCVLID